MRQYLQDLIAGWVDERIPSLVDDLAKARKSLAKIIDQRDELRAEVASLSAKNQANAKEIEDLTLSVEHGIKAGADHHRVKGELEAKIDVLEASVSRLTAQNGELAEQVNALESKNRIQADEISSLTLWVERELALKEKHVALHERAKYMALNSQAAVESDSYGDDLS